MLKVSNVCVRFAGASRAALTCAELTVAAGEVVAVTGPSGCGKSTLGRAILGLLPEDAAREGTVQFHDLVLSELDESDLRPLRGKRIAWIPQDVAASLSAYRSIGRQLAEVAQVHAGLSRRGAMQRAEELLTRLKVTNAGLRMREHPHQWSGGMLQRALVVMALMVQPELVIADEPTSALDAEARQAVADMLRARVDDGAGVLLISHDPSLATLLRARVVALSRATAS
jgi:ABC-type glutathione transport system ATPase component